MKKHGFGFAFALAITAAASSAYAQINSPPPTLMGQPSYHLYTVPGVTTSGMETFFACTNVTSANIRVGVEIFGFAGGAAFNDASASSVDIAAGGAALFGTSPTVWVSISSDLAPGPISKASARILATANKGIICTAYLADPGNYPPTSMADLAVVAKTKQRGD